MFKARSLLDQFRAAWRQRRHPPEFRIGEPLWPSRMADELSEALQRAAAERQTRRGAGLVDEQVVAIGTQVWRLRNEIMKQADGPRAATLGYARSYLDSLWEQMAEAGIEIRDHTGEPVPKTGIYMLKTIAHQPMEGIKHQRVIETLKPTIYFNKKILQVGEVIVGIPKPSN